MIVIFDIICGILQIRLLEVGILLLDKTMVISLNSYVKFYSRFFIKISQKKDHIQEIEIKH
jgi:hypothetical protein